MEDGRYLTILHEMQIQLQENIVEFNKRANGINDRDQLLALRAEQYEALIEIVHRHKRHIAFMQGKPVEPEMHFGHAVLLPAGGMG
jgi:hypothetical protein